MANEIIAHPTGDLVKDSNVDLWLKQIRPEWQSKSLIGRVKRLIPVDPSSACQRLLNAAIHDLRDKVKIAGLDIAAEAASTNKLPPLASSEDVDEYSTYNTINLAYRMGLLSRPEWRKLCRCYEIRRDLEHEDNEYEAGVEDCVYIFSTCIETVLSRDPIHLVRVKDFKDLIETTSMSLGEALIEDYTNAPKTRQIEILKMLVSVATDKDQPDIVQQNAFLALSSLRAKSQPGALAEVGTHIQSKTGREIDERVARVANAAGVLEYLRKSARAQFFSEFHDKLKSIGTSWTSHEHHGGILRKLQECGGLVACPPEERKMILKWLVLTYLGKPGGRTSYGNVRHVFYSNSAVIPIQEILKESASLIRADLEQLRKNKRISELCENQHIARRFEDLADLVGE